MDGINCKQFSQYKMNEYNLLIKIKLIFEMIKPATAALEFEYILIQFNYFFRHAKSYYFMGQQNCFDIMLRQVNTMIIIKFKFFKYCDNFYRCSKCSFAQIYCMYEVPKKKIIGIAFVTFHSGMMLATLTCA